MKENGNVHQEVENAHKLLEKFRVEVRDDPQGVSMGLNRLIQEGTLIMMQQSPDCFNYMILKQGKPIANVMIFAYPPDAAQYASVKERLHIAKGCLIAYRGRSFEPFPIQEIYERVTSFLVNLDNINKALEVVCTS